MHLLKQTQVASYYSIFMYTLKIEVVSLFVLEHPLYNVMIIYQEIPSSCTAMQFANVYILLSTVVMYIHILRTIMHAYYNYTVVSLLCCDRHMYMHSEYHARSL